MLIKYEGVVNIFNENIRKTHFWAFSWMSHYFRKVGRIHDRELNFSGLEIFNRQYSYYVQYNL